MCSSLEIPITWSWIALSLFSYSSMASFHVFEAVCPKQWSTYTHSIAQCMFLWSQGVLSILMAPLFIACYFPFLKKLRVILQISISLDWFLTHCIAQTCPVWPTPLLQVPTTVLQVCVTTLGPIHFVVVIEVSKILNLQLLRNYSTMYSI